jgi:hypothetical protein
MGFHDDILKKLCILNFEIKNILVSSYLRLMCNCTEFRLSVILESDRPPIQVQTGRWINFFL